MTRDTYVDDDFGDNALTGRSGQETGLFAHPNNDTEAGDFLVGMTRPEWTAEGGSTTAANQRLELDHGDSAKTHSNMAIGSWEHTFQYPSIDNEPYLTWVIMSTEPYTGSITSNGYHIESNVRLSRVALIGYSGSGFALINTSWTPGTSEYTMKVTRDFGGNFELLLDGTSEGTATDTTHNTSVQMGLTEGNDIVRVSEITVE